MWIYDPVILCATRLWRTILAAPGIKFISVITPVKNQVYRPAHDDGLQAGRKSQVEVEQS